MESSSSNRDVSRVRFRLRTLLIAPLVVAALLLIAFPKLVTGDFLKVEVKSIEKSETGYLRIELATTISSGTGWQADIGGGTLNSLACSGQSWTRTIPTWPKRSSLTVTLGVSRDGLPPEMDDVQDVLTINVGDTYRLTPDQPLDLARVKGVNGTEETCRFEVVRENRLGL